MDSSQNVRLFQESGYFYPDSAGDARGVVSEAIAVGQGVSAEDVLNEAGLLCSEWSV
jgi:hypothetical protein